MSQKKKHSDNFTLKQKIGIIWFVVCILILMFMFLDGGLLFAQYPLLACFCVGWIFVGATIIKFSGRGGGYGGYGGGCGSSCGGGCGGGD